jgi:hypothetical protein
LHPPRCSLLCTRSRSPRWPVPPCPHVFPRASSPVHLRFARLPCKSTPPRVPLHVFPSAPLPRPLGYMASIASQRPRAFTRMLSLARLHQSTCAHAPWAPQLPSYVNTRACPLAHLPSRQRCARTLDHTASLASPHSRTNARVRSLVHLPSRTFPRSSWAMLLPSQVGTDARLPAHLPSRTPGYVASSQVGVTRWGSASGSGSVLLTHRARPHRSLPSHLATTTPTHASSLTLAQLSHRILLYSILCCM